MYDGSITIRLGVELREIERLNRCLRLFGELHELSPRTIYAVNLALDELVTNAILHGFEKPGGEEIVVHVSLAAGLLSATVEDTGRPFDPHSLPAPDLTAPLAERRPGGLGVHLVRSLMDRTEYCREGAKNVLTLQKKVR